MGRADAENRRGGRSDDPARSGVHTGPPMTATGWTGRPHAQRRPPTGGAGSPSPRAVTPRAAMPAGPSTPASATPFSVCYAPSPSTVREKGAQRRVKERSRREGAQQTVRKAHRPAERRRSRPVTDSSQRAPAAGAAFARFRAPNHWRPDVRTGRVRPRSSSIPIKSANLGRGVSENMENSGLRSAGSA